MASQQIYQITKKPGLLTANLSEINDHFSDLYKSDSPEDDGDMIFFSMDLMFLKYLETPLKLSEISDAIKLMQSKKSPGTRWLPGGIFKKVFQSVGIIALRNV